MDFCSLPIDSSSNTNQLPFQLPMQLLHEPHSAPTQVHTSSCSSNSSLTLRSLQPAQLPLRIPNLQLSNWILTRQLTVACICLQAENEVCGGPWGTSGNCSPGTRCLRSCGENTGNRPIIRNGGKTDFRVFLACIILKNQNGFLICINQKITNSNLHNALPKTTKVWGKWRKTASS